jgi:hypothetical protein
MYYYLNYKKFLVVINAQLERKRKLASELSIERQRLEIMKKNVIMMEEDIARRRSYSRKVCCVNYNFAYVFKFFLFDLD